MKIFKSFIACFSTYSRIPMPSVELDSEDMRYAMFFLPLVGLVIAIVEYIAFLICGYFLLPDYVSGTIMSVIPVLISGGIHIDGYMDTMDALNSYSDKEKKLSIMKDPHTGAFSVIYLLVYTALFFAFTSLVCDKSIADYCIVFILGRIASGISVLTIVGAKKDGMLRDIKKNSEKSSVLYSLLALYIVEILILSYESIIEAIVVFIVSVIGYFSYKKMVMKNFGGITGDTSGWYLCVMELLFIIIVSVGGII